MKPVEAAQTDAPAGGTYHRLRMRLAVLFRHFGRLGVRGLLRLVRNRVLRAVLIFSLRFLPVRASRWLFDTLTLAFHSNVLPDAATLDRNVSRVLPDLLPEAQASSLGERHRRYCMDTLYDNMLLLHADRKTLAGHVSDNLRCTGLEELEQALGGGKGAILCGMHVGYFYLVPLILALKGYEFSLLFRNPQVEHAKNSQPALREILQRMEVVYSDNVWALYKLAKKVRSGHPVLVYPDILYPSGGRGRQPITLLGSRFFVDKGIAWLHVTTGAPILTVTCTAEGDRRHLAIREIAPCNAPRSSPVTLPKEEALGGLLDRLFERIDREIRAHLWEWAFLRNLARAASWSPR